MRLDIHTHAAGGLTKSDFILAAKISELYDNKNVWNSGRSLEAQFKTFPKLDKNDYAYYLHRAEGWEEKTIFHSRLTNMFTFKNFKESMLFFDKLWRYSIEQSHFPDIYIFWNTVRVDLHQRRAKYLSSNLFISASVIDSLYSQVNELTKSDTL